MAQTPKFFITHSWKDIDFAQRLTDDLRKHGLEGFFDAYSIQPGDDIASRIAHGLEECDVYVPLLSPAAIESKWCELEIHATINLSMEKGRDGRPRIIPVIIEPCKLPLLLRGRLYINFHQRYEDALSELLIKGFNISIGSPAPTIQTMPRTIIGKDGKEMILILAGEFIMGEGGNAHKVYLDSFYIDRYPVTNAEYKKFLDATNQQSPYYWTNGKIPQGKENHPVADVSWQDANDYAHWAGKQLPTEAQWEKAASWDDIKKEKRAYPWGKDFDASKCNTSESGIKDTTPVGKYSPHGDSPYGISDMAGSVFEWCTDWYDEDYCKNSPQRNPKNETPGQDRVVRGGSWVTNMGAACTAFRYYLNWSGRGSYSGFRYVE